MSGGHASPKGAGARLVQGIVLALLTGLLFIVSRYFPAFSEQGGVVSSIGFLLLAGTITSQLIEPLKLPHLTGYLLAGAIAGPYILKLVNHYDVEEMTFVNSMALSLIAFAGGAELRLEALRKSLKSLSWAMLVQSSIGLLVLTAAFYLCRPLIPFLKDMPRGALFGISLLWGSIAISRSPSACLGILAQTRAKGPVTDFSLGFIMLSDVVVAILFAGCMVLARPLIVPDAPLSLKAFQELGHELLGSVAIGTTLGLALALYIRVIGTQLILVLVAMGVGAWEVIRYLSFDSLLAFLTAGFVVQNLSGQGEKFLHTVEQVAAVVFVLFFATAGAHLNIPLLAQLWPAALVLALVRAVSTVASARLASNLAKDPPLIKRWGWSGLISQAGLTLGLVVLVEKAYPSFGTAFRALGIAAVAVNEMVGPILFKLGLDKSGESSTEPPITRQELASRPPGTDMPPRTIPPPALAQLPEVPPSDTTPL